MKFSLSLDQKLTEYDLSIFITIYEFHNDEATTNRECFYPPHRHPNTCKCTNSLKHRKYYHQRKLEK